MVEHSLTQVTLPELLALQARAKQLRFKRSHSRATATGSQQSPVYGRGMDYAESRAYQSGDDIRRLDWRLAARTGKLHTKIFQEDHQGCLMVLLDTHASMQFGTRGCFKSVQAAKSAALAAWLAIQSGEQTALACFGEHSTLIKPTGGRRGALTICNALAKPSRTAPITLEKQLNRLRALPQRPSHLLLISDGFCLNDDNLRRLAIAGRHAKLSVLGIADALECRLPPKGQFAMALDNKPLLLGLFGRQRQRFFQQMNQGQQKLQRLAKQQRLPYQQLSGEAQPVKALNHLLAREFRQ